MKEFQYIALREKPELMNTAAQWFNSKWGVPTEAYLECMESYLKQETELGWFLCLDGEKIVGGLGVIENDFHDRPDLTPNVCAVYTEESHRKMGIAGNLLLGFYCDLDGDDTIRIDENELSMAGWYDRHNLPAQDDGISLTREMIRVFSEGKEPPAGNAHSSAD